MASTPRNFRPKVPIHVVFRWNFRLTLFEQFEELEQLFGQLLARWSSECKTHVLAWSVRPTHGHLVLTQDCHGYKAREGASATMRNVLSGVAIKANQLIGHVGRITERPFRSRNLETQRDLLRALAYCNGQEEHHTGDASPAIPGAHDSRAVLRDDRPDGLVTDLPVFPELADLPDEAQRRVISNAIEAIIARAVELEHARRSDELVEGGVLDPAERLRTINPWLTAVDEIAAELGLPLSMRASATHVKLVPIGELLSADEHRERRRQRLAYRCPHLEGARRQRPASAGDVLTLVVTRC